MACKLDGSLPRLNLILLGKTGAGKSATGNTILGREAFASELSASPTTQKVQMENVVIDGVSIDVYDTPELFNTEMKKCLSVPLDGDVPTVFLLVIQPNRLTEEHKGAVKAAQETLGERFLQNTWMLFTRKDVLKQNQKTIKTFIEESRHLPQLLEKCNNRYHNFDNTANEANSEDQGKELLDKIREEVKSRVKKNIILLGKSGAGKSATANTILAQSRFTSKTGHTSVTLNTQKETVTIRDIRSVTPRTQKETVTIRDININLFDTPGLYNTVIREEEVIREYRCLSLLADSVPTVFLLVLRAERPTLEDMRAVEEIERLLGDQLLQRTWILFTRGAELQRGGPPSVEAFIQGSNHLNQVVQRFKNGYHIFNNKTSNRDQVWKLLDKIDNSPVMMGEMMKMTLTLKDKPPTWNFILLGKSGAGKSCSANTILDQSLFTSKSGFSSVTLSTQKEKVTIRDISINLFDTPGLYNTVIREEEVIREYRCLSLFADSVPTVFLLVLRAERPTLEDIGAVEEIETLLGAQLLQRTWILFTRGDELQKDHLSIEQFIEHTEELKRVIQRFNNRYHVFNNKINDPDQVRRLIEKTVMGF